MILEQSSQLGITLIHRKDKIEIIQGISLINLERQNIRELINRLETIEKDTIRAEMDADMEDSGMAQGEIESCLNHWSNKYNITRK